MSEQEKKSCIELCVPQNCDYITVLYYQIYYIIAIKYNTLLQHYCCNNVLL